MGVVMVMSQSMKPKFGTYSRYGAQTLYTDLDNVEEIARKLIDELKTEQFEEPDDEHTDVSIYRDDWAISVSVYGRVTLSDMSWITGSRKDNPKNAKYMTDDLYMRDVPDKQLISLMADLARGEINRVRAAEWKTLPELPPYVQSFYRNAP
jgi:hypothetical protein